MRFSRSVFGALGFLLFVSVARADDFKPICSIYLNLDGVLPVSPTDFSTYRNPGFGGGGGIGLEFSKIFSIVFDSYYNNLPINTSKYPGYTITGENMSDLLILANTKLKFIGEDNPVVPYAIGGLGLSIFSLDAGTVKFPFPPITLNLPPGSQTNFAYRLGIGVDVKLDKNTAIFIETNGIGTTWTITGHSTSSSETWVYAMENLGVKFNL